LPCTWLTVFLITVSVVSTGWPFALTARLYFGFSRNVPSVFKTPLVLFFLLTQPFRTRSFPIHAPSFVPPFLDGSQLCSRLSKSGRNYLHQFPFQCHSSSNLPFVCRKVTLFSLLTRPFVLPLSYCYCITSISVLHSFL